MLELTLRPVEDSDISRFEIWLNKEHILKYYHDADEWLNEIKERHGAFAFLNHFIVSANEIPIGFGQWYDCFNAKEEWYAVEKPNEVFSIDYFIGEEDYLKKGYGKAIVKALVELIKQQQPDARIIVQPEPENTASGKALLANGFIYDEDKQYYEKVLE
ncbi:MAG: GNAT family N-acetyltransferase [Prevotellaceae bacterium]|jgi:RimJ/RimL family protein N-acetyltransferase|nr:GNAT family N-acetyltransferase [Prevotellaceae bacterium]